MDEKMNGFDGWVSWKMNRWNGWVDGRMDRLGAKLKVFGWNNWAVSRQVLLYIPLHMALLLEFDFCNI